MNLRSLALLVFLTLFLSGCGEDFDSAEVSGIVTLDGEPLKGATVMFVPIVDSLTDPAPSSSGRTDAEGRYRLSFIMDAKMGAMIGEHKVTITVPGDEVDDSNDEILEDAKNLIPDRYNVKSELTIQVGPQGAEAANFELKSDE